MRSVELRNVPGIGATIFGNVDTLLTTGELPVYDELRATFPAGLRECLRVPRLGARKVKALFDALAVDSLDALEQACLDGRLAGIRGFGPRSAQHILKGIAFVRGAAPIAGRAFRLDDWTIAGILSCRLSEFVNFARPSVPRG